MKTRLSVVASGILGKRRMRRGPARPNPAAAHPAQGRCHCRPATHPAARPAAAPVAARGRVATRSQTGSGKVTRRSKVVRDIFTS